MSDSAEERSEQLPAISPWKVGVAVMMAGIFAFVLFILARLLLPANWEFTIEASTQVAELTLPANAETRWQVDGAVICSRSQIPLPDAYKLESSAAACGSRTWKAWQIPDPEQVVRLNGGSSVVMQQRAEGGFVMSLRAAGDTSLGSLSVVGIVEDADLGGALNLIWPEVPEQSLTLPFSAATTLGRAVSWSSTRLLQSGSVVVYTADESADKRTMVDEASLMLGDQVRLGEPEPGRAWPKGFVRVDPGGDGMQVVAFGRAGSLRIERFGESGYDFKPSVIRKIAADPAVAFWGSLLAAYMTLILSLQPFVQSDDEAKDAGPATDMLSRFSRWLRKRPAK